MKDAPIVYHGDCLDVLEKHVPAGSVNLVVTSPPYAMARKDIYGGVPPEDYVDWFLPRAGSFWKVLADDGSFVLNIKEHRHNGVRHPYVHDLVHGLRYFGWALLDEYIWHKTNPMPGRHHGRLPDGFERLFHFAKHSRPKWRPEALLRPVKRDNAKRKNSLTRQHSATGSGMSYVRKTMESREQSFPSNVITCAVVGRPPPGYHPAAFPKDIPRFFIKLLTDEGDTVLDPFAGSGTTLLEAIRCRRECIGVELQAEYCDVIRREIDDLMCQPDIFDSPKPVPLPQELAL